MSCYYIELVVAIMVIRVFMVTDAVVTSVVVVTCTHPGSPQLEEGLEGFAGPLPTPLVHTHRPASTAPPHHLYTMGDTLL